MKKNNTIKILLLWSIFFLLVGKVQAQCGSPSDAPTINTLTPTNGATGVATNATLTMVFHCWMIKGTGDITITPINPAGTAIVIPVSSSDVSAGPSGANNFNVVISGLSLNQNTQYEVTMPSGVLIRQTSPNMAFAGLTTNQWRFTTTAPAPTLSSRSPLHNATGVATSTNLTLTFDMPVAKGTGNIEVQAITPAGTTQNVDVTGANVTVASNVVTIANAGFALNSGTLYEIRVPNTAFVRSGGATSPAFAGITANNWRFTTQGVAPILTSTSPTNGATNVLNTATLGLTFNVNVKKGTSGNITITPITPSGTAIVKAITSGDVTIAGNVVTIASLGLVNNTLYEVTVDANAILANDPGSEPYAGFGTGVLRFVTEGVIRVTQPTLATACRDNSSFKSLGTIPIEERSVDNFAIGSGQILILNMPTNFELNPGVGSVSVVGTDITVSSYFISSTKIFIIYNVTATADINQLNITGLQVKANTSATTGSITRDAASTAQMDGIATIISYADLTSVALPSTPALASGADTDYCVGDNLAIASLSIDNPTTFTYKWYSNASLTTLLHTGSSASIGTNLGVSNAAPGSYTFYVVRENATTLCQSAPLAVTVNVYASPTINVSSNDSDNEICEGGSIQITFFGTATSYTITVNGSPVTAAHGTVTNITGGVRFTSNVALADGSYLVQATGSLNGCTASTSLTFVINPTPTVVFNPTRTSFSVAEPIYTLIGGSGSPSGGTGMYSGPGVNSTNGTFNPGVAGLGSHVITFSYTTTDGCTGQATRTFTVTSGSSTILGINAIECSGTGLIGPLTPSPTIYTGSLTPRNPNLYPSPCSYGCTPGDDSYYITTYDRGIANFIVYSSGQYHLDLNAINAYTGGFYPFTFELEVGGCGIDAGCQTQLITINKRPDYNDLRYNYASTFNQAFNASVPFTAFCRDAGNLELIPNITSPSGGGNFMYELRTLPAGSFSTLTNNIINLSTLTAGTSYEIRATFTDFNTCPVSITKSFRIYADPVLSFSYNAASNFCAGSALLSMNTSSTTDPTGAYSTTRGQFTILDATATNIIFVAGMGSNAFSASFLGVGNYTLRYTYQSAAGCKVSLDQAFTINAPPTPTFTFDAGVGQCADVATITVTTSPTMAAGDALWVRKVGSPSFVQQTPGQNTINLGIPANRVGTYEVYYTYTDGNNCTANSPIQSFTVYPLPAVDFAMIGGTGAGSNEYCANTSNISLVPSRSNGTLVGTSGFFRFVKGTDIINLAAGDNDVNIATELFAIGGTGSYNVTYRYTDENGCFNASTVKTLIINPVPTPDFTGLLAGYCEDLVSFTLTPLVNGTAPAQPNNGRFGVRQIAPTTGTEFFIANGVNDIPVKGTGAIPVLTPGTYEIRYLYTNASGCTASSTIRTFLVRPLPSLSFTLPSPVCQDIGSITLSPNITGGSFRFVKGVFNVTLANGDVNVNVTTELVNAGGGVGNYDVTYTYTDANGCTNTTAVQTLVVNPLPSPDLSGLGANYCVSAADVTLTPLPAAGGTFRIRRTLPSVTTLEVLPSGIFKPSAPLPSSPLPGLPTLADRNSKAGTYEVTYTYTDGNGCTNTSVVKTVVVNTIPDVDFVFQGGISTYCVDASSVNMTPSRANGTLTGANGFFTISRGSPSFTLILANDVNTFNPSTQLTPGVGNYNVTYTYTDENGCANTSPAKTLTIVPLPTPTVTGFNASYCVDATAFALTPNPAAGGTFRIRRTSPVLTTYEVFSGSFNPSAPLPSDPLPGSPTLADRNSKAGIYEVTYTYTDGNGCINTSPAIQIVVTPLPDVNFNFGGGISAYCEDASLVTLIPTRANGGITGANGYFTITRSSPAFSLTLANGDNDFNPSTDLLPAPDRDGIYQITYTYTDENSCTYTSPSQNLTIYPLPDLTVTGHASAYCISDPSAPLTGLNNSVAAAGGTFRIRRTLPSLTTFEIFGGTFSPAAPLPSSPLPSSPTLADRNSKAGTYEVIYTYTDGNGCVNTSPAITIVVNPLPVVTFLYPNSDKDDYCEDQGDITLIPQLDGGVGVIIPARGFFTITRAMPAFSLTLANGDNTVNVTTELAAVPNNIGDYTVTYTYTDPVTNCVNVSPARILTINPLPVLTFEYPKPDGITEDTTYCENATSLTLAPIWSNAGGRPFVPSSGFFRFTIGSFTYNAPAGVNTINPSINLVQAGGSFGIYQVTYHYTDANGCTNVSPARELRIYPLPRPDFSYSNACFGDVTQFVATINLPTIDANDGITDIIWDFGDGTIATYTGATLSQGYNVTHAYNIAITYQAKLTVITIQGCSNTFIKNVRIGAIPVAGFNASRFCQGDPVRFVSTSTIAPTDSIARVIWDFGDGNQETIDIYGSLPAILSPNTQHLYTAPGEYEAQLITISTLGCSDTIRRQVFVFPNVVVTPTTPYNENFENSSGGWLPNGVTGGVAKQHSWSYGVPNGVKINNTNSTNAWMSKRRDSTRYMNNEQSYVESPCFNISSLQRPMIQMKVFYDTDQGGDGAVIQVSKDDGVTWTVLGSVSEGVAWYNTSGIAGLPGGQGLKGWSGRTMTNWVYARYPLDAYQGESKVRFRVAFGSNSDNVTLPAQFDGFTFDEIFIGERNRKVLLEHFTNSSNPTANSENDFINNFPGVTGGEAIQIQYHTSFPGTDPMNADNTADPSARALYYGVSQVPRTGLDGYLKTDAQFSTWGTTAYNQRVLLQSPFSINITYPTNPTELLNISAEINALSRVDSSLIVQIVVVEKEIDGSVFTGANLSNLKFRNVVKRKLPDAAGTRVNQVWQSGTRVVVNQAWNPVNVYDKTKLGVVVFLQNELNKQVYQAFYSDVTTAPTGVTSLPTHLVQSFTLYPNPTKDKIAVGFEGVTVTENYQINVYDQLGRLCKQSTLQAGNQGVVIDVENLADGMYILKLQNAKGEQIVRKFSIVR